MADVAEISRCEVCGGATLAPVLNLGEQPLCDDLVPLGAAARPKGYPLELVACETCKTVHQRFQVEKKLLFPKTYHYRSAMTQDVLDGMAELVALAEGLCGGLAGKTVLDIGCNDGSLLKQFEAKGARGVGIEPTGAAADAAAGGVKVYNRFFDKGAVEAYRAENDAPDIITFTNVFAHISGLDDVIACLKELMGPQTKLIVENHYLGAVLDKHQFDTFYHEHPRTYSATSFRFIAEKLGLAIEHMSFPDRYNGNIRVVMGKGAGAVADGPDESDFVARFDAMGVYIERRRGEIMAEINALVAQHGPLPAKAFPGRASIILNYFGIDETHISAAYERPASPKIGHYIPGSRIPILSEDAFFCEPFPPVMVNFAWHIRREIETYMRGKGFEGDIVDIFS
ncbi:MAG: class I SAM-dependent methyltransferase [Pseudomonadota bacterium]